VVPGVLPLPVEPEDPERPVARDKLPQLPLHVAHVPVEIRSLRRAFVPWTAGQIVRVMPVHDGVVDAELHALLPAFGGELRQRIAPERSGLRDAPVGEGGIPDAEPVVVLAGDDDVAHSGVLRRLHPLRGIEMHRVEAGGKSLVLFDGHLFIREIPLRRAVASVSVRGICRNGIHSPVDEHPEAGIRPPLRARRELFRRLCKGAIGYCDSDDGCDSGRSPAALRRVTARISTCPVGIPSRMWMRRA